MDEQWRRVFVASGEMQAQQIRAFLDAEGIDSVTRGESLRHLYGLTVDGLGKVEIFVAQADEERARALIASAEAGELRLGDDGPSSQS